MKVKKRCCLLTTNRHKFWWKWHRQCCSNCSTRPVENYFDVLILNNPPISPTRLSQCEVTNLWLHILDLFLKQQQFFSKVVLVITEILCIFLHSLKQCLIVVDRLINAFFILIEVVFVDKFEVIQISMNTFVCLLVLQLDIIEEFLVCCDFLTNNLEIWFNALYPASHVLTLSLHFIITVYKQSWLCCLSTQ
jgi:hypothetical protein